MAEPWKKYASPGAAGPWAKYGTQTAEQPAAAEPPERPGFFKRLGQALGLPTSSEEATGIGEQMDITKHPENAVPGVILGKAAYGVVSSVVDKGKRAVNETVEAGRNIAEGGPVGVNVAKATYSAIPDMGQGYGEDINNKNYLGAGGTALGTLIQAALMKGGSAPEAVTQRVSKIKNALTVSPELEATAARTAPEYTPNPAVQQTAQRTAGQIHEAALPELTQKAGAELDKVANTLGVDTTNTASLSTKAELAGRAAKTSGQKLYAELDKAAAEVAGAPGGNFQRYAQTVQKLEREALDPQLTAIEQEAVAERLNNAKAEFDAFKQEMVKRGLDASTIKQADRFWAQGSALDEVSRGLLNAEDAFGKIKPNARPLDTVVKKTTAPASGRGHILKQAVGDSADTITNATRTAQERIVTEKAATAAAKKTIAAEKEAASRTAKAVKEEAAQAQKRIDVIRGRRKAIGKGALGVLGLGAAASAGYTVKDVLSGW